MQNDIYADSRKLAIILDNKGLHIYHDNIIDAIDYSSTATEILMKLRFILKSINMSDSKLSESDKKLTEQILVQINNAL